MFAILVYTVMMNHNSLSCKYAHRPIHVCKQCTLYLCSSVCAGGDYPLAIGAELNAVDHVTVALVGEDAALPSHVPQLWQERERE